MQVAEHVEPFIARKAEQRILREVERKYSQLSGNGISIELLERMVRVEEGLKAQGEQLRQLLHYMDKRFEAMDKRSAEQREASDRRFEAMDKRSAEQREASDRRFEAMNKRSAEQREASDKRFEAMERRLDRQNKRSARRDAAIFSLMFVGFAAMTLFIALLRV